MSGFPRVASVDEGASIMRTIARLNGGVLGRVADRYGPSRAVAYIVWHGGGPWVADASPIFVVRRLHFIFDQNRSMALDVLIGRERFAIYDEAGTQLYPLILTFDDQVEAFASALAPGSVLYPWQKTLLREMLAAAS